ncbi:MAG: hypothetical protein Q4G42_06160 [Neisseria sp.]|nr:hypothetical protein [Neisseria sp.]
MSKYFSLLIVACSVFWLSTAYAEPKNITLSAADRQAAFEAAGLHLQAGRWVDCAEGVVTDVRDLNGDQLPEAIITQDSAECFGRVGTRFSLVSKDQKGEWRLMVQEMAIPELGKMINGWPEITTTGPGFCFAVHRWNGSQYLIDRYEYAGKPCTLAK